MQIKKFFPPLWRGLARAIGAKRTLFSKISNLIFAIGMPISQVWGYGAVFIGLTSWPSHARELLKNKVFIAVLVFVLYGFIRSIFSPDSALGFNLSAAYFMHWLLPFALGFTVINEELIKKYILIYFSVFFAIVFVSVLAYFGLFWKNFGSFYFVEEGLLKGLRHHIGLAALCLSFSLIALSVGFFCSTFSKLKRVLFVIAGIFLIFAVFLSGSRGYYLAVAAILPAFVFFLCIKSGKIWRSIGVLCVVAIIFCLVYFYSGLVSSRVKSAAAFSDTNVTERIDLYHIAMLEIKDRPVFGFGLGVPQRSAKYFDMVGKKDLLNADGKYRHSHLHSFYLTLLAEEGFVGFVIFLGLIFLIFSGCIKVIKFSNNSFKVAFSIGVMFAFAGVLVGDMFDAHLRGPGVAMDLFWLFGLMLGRENSGK
ncbi:MAG: O-antigen ligase family protein [Endomicrobiales bacterium]|nr:O-antigen ligase family protein [Endomicrobiales bacterium]